MTDVQLGALLREPILVVGGYGYRNLGDEAILAGLLRALGPKRAISVVSRMPSATAALHGVRAVPIHRAIPELVCHRSVLIGGGGLFGHDMGALGRLLPTFALLALALGKQVAIHGVGVDEKLSPAVRLLLPRVASRAAELSVRDAASRDRLGVDPARVSVRPDLSSLAIPASKAVGRRILRETGLDPARPIIGLALTAVNQQIRAPVLDAAADLMRRLPEVQFCFVPMSRHPRVPLHDDLLLGAELQRREGRLAVLAGDLSPAAAMAVFAGFDAAVCMRYHSLLFAARAGIPIAAIPYAPKCNAWLREAGLEPVGLSGDALEARLRQLLVWPEAA